MALSQIKIQLSCQISSFTNENRDILNGAILYLLYQVIILNNGKLIIRFVQYSVYKSATSITQTDMKNLLMNIAFFMQRQHRSPLNGQILNKQLLEGQKSSIDQYYQKDKTEQQLSIFSKLLLQVPIRWVKLLYVDGIQTQTNQIVLNSSSTISKIYQKLIKKWEDIAKSLRKDQERSTSLSDFYINETCLALINQIFNLFARFICDCFMEGRDLLNSQVKKVDDSITKYQMMNSYIAFSLLKQISASTSKIITQRIVRTFPQFSVQDSEQFCKYIQKNYEFIKLKSKDSGQNFIMTQEQLNSYVNQKNSYWLDFIKNNQKNHIKMKKIQSMNGDEGILLVRQKAKKQNESFKDIKNSGRDEVKEKMKNNVEKAKEVQSDEQKLIIKVENGTKIKVVNAKVCQQSWLIFETKDSMTQIYENLKKQIEYNNKNSTKQYVSYGVPTCQYATIGGSLGKCLADINQYNSASQFFIDVSKTATICSTISYAMAEIPILSYFIIAGGFTYSFYIAYNNKATSTFKKVNQIGSYTMSAVGSVGSTLAGIMLGQVVIPVPFVGAFIGGVLGGYVGTKGVRDMNEFLARSQFRQIIGYIKFKQIDKKYWKFTNHLLQRIGLNKQYFNTHTPTSQISKDLQITAICLCIITFYESKRYMQYTKNKLKDHEAKEKQRQKNKKIKSDSPDGENVDVDEEQKQKQGKISEQECEEFVNQFDIVRIVDFLTRSQYSIYQHLDILQNFIRHFVA